MASPAADPDLQAMDMRIEGPKVRERGGRYGEQPIPSERFPAEGVLEDLRHAPEHDLPLIVARYAALRAWMLARGDEAVAGHAVAAADTHLDAIGPDWTEGSWLRHLVDGSTAVRALEHAAREAAGRGHVAGARSLRQAAHRLRWNAVGFPPHWSS
jgi:hypothetical protein